MSNKYFFKTPKIHQKESEENNYKKLSPRTLKEIKRNQSSKLYKMLKSPKQKYVLLGGKTSKRNVRKNKTKKSHQK
jgi:hypothetical protein